MNTLSEKYGLKVPETALKEGIVENQPCRMEVMIKKYQGKKKKVFFDVAHNPQAIVLFLLIYSLEVFSI